MNFEYFCTLYHLGALHSATPLPGGTMSQVWQLETETGTFLLRTLTGREQGEREWAVTRTLSANGFTRFPAIRTVGDTPCTEAEGVWYQVQEWMTGDMPDPTRPGLAFAMGQTVKELTRCMPEGLIHGDLGPWNMLSTPDGLFVIDFGSVREGDSRFDFAAAFAGIINHTPPEDRTRTCREFLRGAQTDPVRLLPHLHLWAEEGISRWTGKSDAMVSRFINALKWAEENAYEL